MHSSYQYCGSENFGRIWIRKKSVRIRAAKQNPQFKPKFPYKTLSTFSKAYISIKVIKCEFATQRKYLKKIMQDPKQDTDPDPDMDPEKNLNSRIRIRKKSFRLNNTGLCVNHVRV